MALYKTKCIDCKSRLYVPQKRMKVRCYDCELEHLGVDAAICWTPTVDAEPLGYFEVKNDNR